MTIENLKELRESIESAMEIIDAKGSFIDSVKLTKKDQDLYSFDTLTDRLKDVCLDELSSIMSEQIKKHNWINDYLVKNYGLNVEMMIRMTEDETDEKGFVEYINKAIEDEQPIYIFVKTPDDVDGRNIRISSNFQVHLRSFFRDYALFRESPNLIGALKWLNDLKYEDIDKPEPDNRTPQEIHDDLEAHAPVEIPNEASTEETPAQGEPPIPNPMAMMANMMMGPNAPFKDVIDDDEENIIDPEKVKALAAAAASGQIPVEELPKVEEPNDIRLEDERDE